MMKHNVYVLFKNGLLRLRSWAESLLFPEGIACHACGRALEEGQESGLCRGCAAALDALEEKQQRLEAADSRALPSELSYVHAAFSYEDPARRLIRMLKYDRMKCAAQPLIDAMAMLPSGEEELIVPVPTTAKRLRVRGFNQSYLLAQGIGAILGMETEDVLERSGEQQAQSKLSGKDRLNNLNGCMHAKRRLDGMRILLVDDVYTTGATAKEAARALLEAGALSVGMFAAARTLPEEEQPPFLRKTRLAKRQEHKEA